MTEITVKGRMGLNNRVVSFNQISCEVELSLTTSTDSRSLQKLSVNGKTVESKVITDGAIDLGKLQRFVSRRVEQEFDYMVKRSHSKTEDELLRPDFDEDEDS